MLHTLTHGCLLIFPVARCPFRTFVQIALFVFTNLLICFSLFIFIERRSRLLLIDETTISFMINKLFFLFTFFLLNYDSI